MKCLLLGPTTAGNGINFGNTLANANVILYALAESGNVRSPANGDACKIRMPGPFLLEVKRRVCVCVFSFFLRSENIHFLT